MKTAEQLFGTTGEPGSTGCACGAGGGCGGGCGGICGCGGKCASGSCGCGTKGSSVVDFGCGDTVSGGSAWPITWSGMAPFEGGAPGRPVPVVVPGRPKRLCCWTCKDMSNWDTEKGRWIGGWEWTLICGYSRDGGITVVESDNDVLNLGDDDIYLGIGTRCNRPCPDEANCQRHYPGLDTKGEATFEGLQDSFRKYALSRGLSEAQTTWGLTQLKSGCIGIARAAAGSRDLGVSCWKTREEAEKELKELKELPGCCPVMYGIQMHNDEGRDNINPDAKEGEGGRVDLRNWDGQGPSGEGVGHFNFGVVLDDNTIVWADNMHNPDSDGDGVGDTYPSVEPQEMAVISGSNDDFDAIVDNHTFNYSVWCVRCHGRFG